MKRFLFDIDGVLADIMTEWLILYNYDWKDKLKPSDITGWNIHNFVKPECGKRIYEYLDYPDFYKNVKPYTFAVRFVREIRGMMPIGFVTTVTKGSRGAKLRWLDTFGFFLPEDLYIETSTPEEKHSVEGAYLLDDYVENLRGFSGEGILMNRAWNLKEDYHLRVFTYTDVLNMLYKEVSLCPK